MIRLVGSLRLLSSTSRGKSVRVIARRRFVSSEVREESISQSPDTPVSTPFQTKSSLAKVFTDGLTDRSDDMDAPSDRKFSSAILAKRRGMVVKIKQR